jgi:hypothetical protein
MSLGNDTFCNAEPQPDKSGSPQLTRSVPERAQSSDAFRWPAYSLAILTFLLLNSAPAVAQNLAVLKPGPFAHYVEHFNTMEDENITNAIPNAASWDWMQREIPFFSCPDSEVEEMYYFRWWSFRKHLVQTTNGLVITEFLTPVRHAGVFNTISCATGFHIAEGRWLEDQNVLDDYIHFWLRGNAGQPEPHFHKFSSWFAAAVYDRYLVTGDRNFTTNLLADLAADYRAWEQEHQTTKGLYWQFDVRDGMEESISGSRTVKNLRPTINSYMFGNARALAKIARLAGNTQLAEEFDQKAADLKRLTEQLLWDPQASFFEVRRPDGSFSNAREEIGFVPWMFELPSDDPESLVAWDQLQDVHGFSAPYGITTAERRHPQFRTHGFGKCEWDGAVWPFATCETLAGLANVLRDYHQTEVARTDYFDNFLTYTHSQHADGRPYIGEYQDETTGQWVNGVNGRSRYYNHSTYADLLITGVVGLVPRADNQVEIDPLLPAHVWNWFCLDGVKYHEHQLAIVWDRDGRHFGHGTGLAVFADGHEIARQPELGKLIGMLP